MKFGFCLAKWEFELDCFDLSWRFGFLLKKVWVSKRSFKKWILRFLSKTQCNKEVISMTNFISMTSDTLKKPLEFENFLNYLKNLKFLEFFKFDLNFLKTLRFKHLCAVVSC